MELLAINQRTNDSGLSSKLSIVVNEAIDTMKNGILLYGLKQRLHNETTAGHSVTKFDILRVVVGCEILMNRDMSHNTLKHVETQFEHGCHIYQLCTTWHTVVRLLIENFYKRSRTSNNFLP
ncbi:uncharacterized protein LOC143305774 [Osmia lignaria lignaria]|uniref:uncharacterized protein LOC143305774 n=1 Tax=Osmia lignaria lignaria TaxID=1437193 RepID=UPI00402BD2AD